MQLAFLHWLFFFR